jgi:hypothetical protein
LGHEGQQRNEAIARRMDGGRAALRTDKVRDEALLSVTEDVPYNTTGRARGKRESQTVGWKSIVRLKSAREAKKRRARHQSASKETEGKSARRITKAKTWANTYKSLNLQTITPRFRY